MPTCPHCSKTCPTVDGVRRHINAKLSCRRLDQLRLFEVIQNARPIDFDDPDAGEWHDEPPNSSGEEFMDVDSKGLLNY